MMIGYYTFNLCTVGMYYAKKGSNKIHHLEDNLYMYLLAVR